MKILLIEDDRETAAHVVHALHGDGHVVEQSNNGIDGLTRARAGEQTMLIVDRMLPGLDGLSLINQLRTENNHTPVLFLSTMSGLEDRVQGLKGGGDDYLTKPFALEELLARVNAIARRHGSQRAPSETIKIVVGPLELDLIRRTVKRDGKVIELLPQEFLLLEHLMRNAGRIMTRKMLLEQVWDLHFDPRTSIVETHMSRLRSKIDRGYTSVMIHSQRGIGYFLDADPISSHGDIAWTDTK
jgi:two-component system OmpR family response regulator